MSALPQPKKIKRYQSVSEPLKNKKGIPTVPVSLCERPAQQEVDPLLAKLVLIDWSSPSVLENSEAVKAINELIKNCHAEVLRWILILVKDRIHSDARLWSMKEDVIDLLQLGRDIYE